jgi:hypothetical protein
VTRVTLVLIGGKVGLMHDSGMSCDEVPFKKILMAFEIQTLKNTAVPGSVEIFSIDWRS